MASTNVKTVHQSSLLHTESNLYRLEGLLSPTQGQPSQQQSGQITLQSVLINRPRFLKATHRSTEIWKIEIPRYMVVEACSWWSRRASRHSAVQSPMHPWKSPTNLARSPLLVGPRRKKTDRGQTLAFPSETSRFAPCTFVLRRGFSRTTPRHLAHLPFAERIWCLVLTGPSPPSRFPLRYANFGAMTVGTNGLAWRSTGSAPPTTPDMPLTGHSTPGLLNVSSLPRFGSTPAGRKPRQAGRKPKQGVRSMELLFLNGPLVGSPRGIDLAERVD